MRIQVAALLVLALTGGAAHAQTVARYDYVEQPPPYGTPNNSGVYILTALTRPMPSTGLDLEIQHHNNFGYVAWNYFLLLGTEPAWVDVGAFRWNVGARGVLMLDPIAVVPLGSIAPWGSTTYHMPIPTSAALAGISVRQQVLAWRPPAPWSPTQLYLSRLGIATCGIR